MCARAASAPSCSGLTIDQICGIMSPCPSSPASERLPSEMGAAGVRGPLIYGSDCPPYEAGLALTHHLLERMQIPADEELVNRLTFEQID
jgi:hypothetical protein